MTKILYYIGYALWYSLSLLPLRVLYVLSDLLYVLVSRIVRYRHRGIWNNLKVSFPEKTDQEIRRIEHDFYHYFCDYLVETIKMMTISERQLRQRMTFTGMEELNRVLSSGQSCSVYLGHVGNWEWITSLPFWVSSDVQCAQIYHPLENAASDKLFLKVRERLGARCIAMNDTLREVVRYRREGRTICVGYISDQKPHWVNIHHWVDFLNHDTPVLTGTERIARSTGHAVFYADVTRKRRGYYNCDMQLITTDPKSTNEWELTDRYFSSLEQTILRDPAIWLWSHDRWKRTREEFNRRFEVKDGKVIRKPVANS
jgi:KDO2-lipid IV(A) lauroyltransferase